jgi:streptogramin lyase
MRKLTFCRIFSVIVALAAVTGCSDPSQSSALGAAQAQRSSGLRSNGRLTFTVYTAGQTPGFLSTAAAVDLAPDSAGNMWFTDGGTPAIGRIAPDGTVTEFTSGLPAGAEPYSIVAGSDGNMWFSDYRGMVIGEVTPDGTITEYDGTQYTNSKAMGIAVDAHARPGVIGFGSQPLLAHLTKTDTIAAQKLPVQMTPNGALTSDSEGDFWFIAQDAQSRAELMERAAQSPRLIRTPLHMQAAFEPCCPNVAPKSIVIGPDGNPWFTTLDFARVHSNATFVGTLRGGQIYLFAITHRGLKEDAFASGLASAENGLWMTGSDPFADNGALWHIDVSGTQKGYNLPYNPRGLTVDADGNPWFTAASSGAPSQIVEVTAVTP